MAAIEELKCMKDRTTENNKKFKVAIIACLMFWEIKKPCIATAKRIMLMPPFFNLECSLGSYAPEVHTDSPDANLMIPCFNYQLLPGGFLRLQIQQIASIGK